MARPSKKVVEKKDGASVLETKQEVATPKQTLTFDTKALAAFRKNDVSYLVQIELNSETLEVGEAVISHQDKNEAEIQDRFKIVAVELGFV